MARRIIHGMNEPIPFSGNPLDRASNLRRDAEWLATHRAHPASRYLAFYKLNALSSNGELLWLSSEQVSALIAEGAEPFFLGVRDEAAHFAVDVSHVEEPLEALGLQDVEFADSRAAAARLPSGEPGIIAHGRALIEWHRRHRFCGVCATETEVRDGGSMRKCPSCDTEHFPRTDPVVIMVVWRGDKCILGRQKAWAPGFYSALAGFIDQGETIEEAVAREVLEEVGLKVDAVEYHASQPWPFPSSLMIGCFAHATHDDETVDPVELESARWFTRDELREAFENPGPQHGFNVPARIAIAHHIIKDWVFAGPHLHAPE
jgi:NAD+ diphosphatase